MSALICDTGGLLAAFDVSDPDHDACAKALGGHPGPYVLSPLVVAELDHLVRRRISGSVARDVLDELGSGAYTLAALTPEHLAACREVDARYEALGLGVTDCHLVVLADENATTELLSLDERHFRAVRPLGHGRAFRLLPADGPRRSRARP